MREKLRQFVFHIKCSASLPYTIRNTVISYKQIYICDKEFKNVYNIEITPRNKQ